MDVEQEKHIVRDRKRLGIGFFTFARSNDAQRWASIEIAPTGFAPRIIKARWVGMV